MNKICVGAASLNQIPLDWEDNQNRILETIQKAKNEGVDFLCLPELCITGYGCEDAFFYSFVQEKAIRVLYNIAAKTEGILVSVGLPIMFKNTMYNCAAVLLNGGILGFVPKQNLSSDGVHYEGRWFKPWPKNIVEKFTDQYGCEHSIGDLTFSFNNVKLGFEICEDAWVANRPGISLAKKGVNLIFNPSASHFAFDKHKVRENFIIDGSRAFRCIYVYSNLIGNESGRIIFSGDCYIAQNGKMISSCGGIFPDLISRTLDISNCSSAQIQTASFAPEFNNAESIENYPFWPKRVFNNKPAKLFNPGNKFVQFEEALVVGLYDYMRKTNSSGYVVSLSGGADSTVCALLVHLMAKTFNLHTKDLLTCVYQKTKNSSEYTENSAKYLAEDIGADYHSIDVDSLVNSYTSLAEKIINREIKWKTDDIALQNIQARVRAPSVWMIANIKNAILLSTSNRSEAAVGYATLDGDTCGGLAPIAGVDKQFILDWLKSTTSFSPGVANAIDRILETKPTAELRPLNENQTDEDDLMPYKYLDIIERLAIHNKKSPQEILDNLNETHNPSEIKPPFILYIKRFFKLWARNQYKRERYAVSFHLDDANLDPKSWCRFPVLNSAFEEELEDLKDE